MTAAVFGSTGAVGSQILTTLITTDAFLYVKTISRRLPNARSPKLQALEEVDISKWSGMISTLSPRPSVVFNAVGTSAIAGIENQRKIDRDLCIANAKAAKEAGVKTYIFVSSAGVRGWLSPFSYVPYSKMKREVEDAIRELAFEHAIIIRPGMILGREKPKNPWLEIFFANLDILGQGVKDSWSQDHAVIGRAAVAAARMVQEGKAPSKYWVLEHTDIVKLGRDEWKESGEI